MWHTMAKCKGIQKLLLSTCINTWLGLLKAYSLQYANKNNYTHVVCYSLQFQIKYIVLKFINFEEYSFIKCPTEKTYCSNYSDSKTIWLKIFKKTRKASNFALFIYTVPVLKSYNIQQYYSFEVYNVY